MYLDLGALPEKSDTSFRPILSRSSILTEKIEKGDGFRRITRQYSNSCEISPNDSSCILLFRKKSQSILVDSRKYT